MFSTKGKPAADGCRLAAESHLPVCGSLYLQKSAEVNINCFWQVSKFSN